MLVYPVPVSAVSYSEEVKKSRFITELSATDGIDAAKAFIQGIRKHHPAATHHCWAFIAGAPNDSQQLGFSDDGEPAGTAGKPILAQLMGSGVGEITAVVVRYYGGVKLGTGGLVKAYGGGVQQALKLLVLKQKILLQEYHLQCKYSLLPQVESIVHYLGGKIVSNEYGADVRIRLALPVHTVDEAEMRLRDISRGVLHLLPISQ
ncbi:IMPACT family protein [Pectobacteriaceae bacterium CE70]|uniref:YigZ family protein n=1 Tax=Serratia sp. (strain ATCC 39006) TaxID=104623 RepID=A0A2I5T1U6_SERS3|nr:MULTISPECIES: IMPACT family protein [Enterobacterales]WJV62819.1 IMPACT family protein [Pectobacteriaceae bacterium C52]WJV67154.1 IMPACT family protein [Pectobacteriaceae bacterium CE70]WJY11138.1 IMPACT family protein [Pectobacteriaceae bacterium C80]AUG98513.1 YigZ family protein [Serratia sp. ATCC 39006]AUH02828.1 YigZ family protein [Serratia sp. ATCC 39006]